MGGMAGLVSEADEQVGEEKIFVLNIYIAITISRQQSFCKIISSASTYNYNISFHSNHTFK